MYKITLPIIFCIFTTACGMKHSDGSLKLPFVYHIDVEQGNVIDQSMLNKLILGMNKAKVTFIMGNALLVDSFHNNRWDYMYSIKRSHSRRAQRYVSLFFEDDKLVDMQGNIAIADKPLTEADHVTEISSVIISTPRKERGFWSRLLSSDNQQRDTDTTAQHPATGSAEPEAEGDQ